MSVQKRTDIFNAPKRACKPLISGIDGSLDKRRKTALQAKKKDAGVCSYKNVLT